MFVPLGLFLCVCFIFLLFTKLSFKRLPPHRWQYTRLKFFLSSYHSLIQLRNARDQQADELLACLENLGSNQGDGGQDDGTSATVRTLVPPRPLLAMVEDVVRVRDEKKFILTEKRLLPSRMPEATLVTSVAM
eukprot:g62778.t1